MADNETLPAVTEADLRASGLPSLMKMSPGLALFFNDAVYARCKAIAGHMSKAEGMTPRHLLGKPEACFAVISRSITWNLDPQAVAMATYQTPGGSIGYYGTLIQAILEASGAFEGGIIFKHEGDWKKVQAKFKIVTGQKGGSYPVPTWGPEEAEGLSVIVSGKMKGEVEPRTLRFELNEAFPLNSPLWATAPNRQICYTAVRAFGNICTPALIMGVPFDVNPTGFYDGTPMQDITPERGPSTPARPNNAFARQEPEAPKPTGEAETGQGQAQEAQDGDPGDGATAALSEATDTQDKPDGGEVGEDEEKALDRGRRLLALCKTIPEVSDLRQSILEEILDDDDAVATWGGACDDRAKVLTGPKGGAEAATARGKPVPADKPKGKGK